MAKSAQERHRRQWPLTLIAAILLQTANHADAAEEMAVAQLTKDCISTYRGAFYPTEALVQGLSGRVMLIIERSPEGKISILEVQRSEPRNEFSAAASAFMKKHKCKPTEEPMQGRVSITFSIQPGPLVPHFDGVPENHTISITATRLHDKTSGKARR